MGAIFKIEHWPGAGILMTTGIASLVFLFIPMALINNYRSGKNREYLSLYIMTWITCFVVFTAMIFKIQHWPGAGIGLTIALPFPYLFFLPVFMAVTGRNPNFSIYKTVYVLLLLVVNSVFSALMALN
jgi:hypothetical protein